jgi:hypothetical protein
MSVLVCPACQHELDLTLLIPHCTVLGCKCDCASACYHPSLFAESRDREPSYDEPLGGWTR